MTQEEYTKKAIELSLKPPSTDMLYGQKFTIGDRVKIIKANSWFTKEQLVKEAIVKYSYSQKYGGKDVKSYCLKFFDGETSSWYDEDELEIVNYEIR